MPAPSCRECGATLRFVQMTTGGRMPVNAVPDPTGSVAARWTGERWAAGYVLKPDEEPRPGFKRFRPHFADCRPAAKRSRSESAAARLF